jgi:hypothetical protein
MTSSNEGTMDISPSDEVVEVDELKEAFDLLEENTQPNAKEYEAILASPRMDDVAVKIKEQCIYKSVYSILNTSN